MTDMVAPNVICVDDEVGILNALKRNLRKHAFNVVTTVSPKQALELLSQNEFAVVISDYRMPEMLGTEFLAKVKEKYPDSQRILLTGQADMDGVVSAVNDGGVHKFFLKPWNSKGFGQAISECVQLYNLQQQNRILTEQLEVTNRALNALNADLTVHLCDTVNRLDESEFYDIQTGLPNEKLLIKSANRSIEARGAGCGQLTFVVIGILDYALLNEALGKEKCTQIIGVIAEQLKHNLRSNDLLARIREDEFCVATRSDGSVEEMAEFANRLIVCALTPRSDGEIKTYVKACAGIGIHGEHGEAPEKLVENARAAMNSARIDVNSNIAFYDGGLRAIASDKVSLNNDLYQAIQNGEFFLNFQPRVNAISEEMVAAEVLLRWAHPQRGVVSPAEFIPILEESGLIVPVGEWIVGETCKLADKLYTMGKPLLLAVNVSPYQFRTGSFHEFVASIVSGAKQPAGDFLELEITESVLVSDVGKALESIRNLKSQGIKLAIDDFGTGYSSLSYLADIPADYLKVDQSFVSTLTTSAKSRAIVASIVSIAESLQLAVIAEGIETEDQAQILKALGCDEMQGYLFSKPVDENSLIKLLDNFRTEIVSS